MDRLLIYMCLTLRAQCMVEHALRIIVDQLFAKLGMVEHAQIFERMARSKSMCVPIWLLQQINESDTRVLLELMSVPMVLFGLSEPVALVAIDTVFLVYYRV